MVGAGPEEEPDDAGFGDVAGSEVPGDGLAPLPPSAAELVALGDAVPDVRLSVL